MKKVTAVQEPILIPRLFEESEPGMARKVMRAWAKAQGKSIVFEDGRTYCAIMDGDRYRFQCQRYTENSGYGFKVESLIDQDIKMVVLFRESQCSSKQYLYYCCTPSEIYREMREGRRTIVPQFDENRYVTL